jgi:hypothetical protein
MAIERETHKHVILEKSLPAPENDPMMAGYGLIKFHTDLLGFRHYSNFIKHIFCTDEADEPLDGCLATAAQDVRDELGLSHFCFTGTRAYDQLREATDLFIGCQVALSDDCCDDTEVPIDEGGEERVDATAGLVRGKKVHEGKGPPRHLLDRLECYSIKLLNQRFAPHAVDHELWQALERRLWDAPSEGGECCEGPKKRVGSERTAAARAGGSDMRPRRMLTFMQQLRDNQLGVGIKDCNLGSGNCAGMLLCKLNCPPLLELIWSYWMEQGMLVQGINNLTLRFQNRRAPGRDPLQRCDLSPLRPLNNLLWGYVQREPDRLSLARRAYEYDHHYGLRLRGSAVPALAPADTRRNFIEAFHRLLQEANRFYRTSMDTTMNADAYPTLNCLRELHLILAEGAHNQFGDLPTTARAEMLIQQWLLARPEVRDFLGGRPGVPYPEPWMPHMDTLRQMMGWNDTSIRHYRDLATYGEQLLLSVRYLPWSLQNDSLVAARWLITWRPEVQGYLHSYRAVTGVDLGAPDVPVIQGGLLTAQPADLIGRPRVGVPGVVR